MCKSYRVVWKHSQFFFEMCRCNSLTGWVWESQYASLIFLSRGQIFLSKEQLSWQLMKKLPLPFHVDCNLLWFEIRTESKGFDIREYSNKAISDPVLLVSISFVQSLLALCFLFHIQNPNIQITKYWFLVFPAINWIQTSRTCGAIDDRSNP